MRLLIIGTGQRPYREYLLRSIATEYDVHLLLSIEPTWERAYASGWTVLPSTLDVELLVAAARSAAAETRIDGVLCWDEARILQTAAVAEALGLPGGDVHAVGRCRDKWLTRQALSVREVAQPESVLVGSTDEALAVAGRIGYPVILKPRALAASLGVVKVASPAELIEQFPYASETTVPEAPSYDRAVLVEELVSGREISVDCAVHRGRVTPMFVAHKEIGFAPYFEEVGHVVDGGDRLLAEEPLLRLLADTHAALGLTDAMTHCEVMLTAEGPKVIEVNARLGGDMIPFIGSRATGIGPGLAAARVACGLPPRVSRTRCQVAAVRFAYADGPVTRLAADALAGDPVIDRFEALIGEHHLSLFPPGTVPGRIAYVTALAESADACRAALDRAVAGLRPGPRAPVAAGRRRALRRRPAARVRA